MNYTTLENQIIAKAAEETEDEIRRAIAPVERLISEPGKGFSTTIRWHGSDHKVSLPFRGMLIPLVKGILLDEIGERRKKAALQGFLNKFNAVVNQIESLGIELEGVAQTEEDS